MMAGLFRLEHESAGQVRVVRVVGDLQAALDASAIAAILHLEGTEATDRDLAALDILPSSWIALARSRLEPAQHLRPGVPFRFPASPDTGPGLTRSGRELVRTCNRLGIPVDVAHLNEQGFWDVAGITDAPIVATHAAVHAICPMTRNLTDRQIDAIGESDGLVGVTFEVSATRPDGHDTRDTPLTVIVDHIDYLVGRIGIDRVGFGSDFDDATIPNALANASRLPNLIESLRGCGYGSGEITKLAHGNWLRVLSATWKPEAIGKPQGSAADSTTGLIAAEAEAAGHAAAPSAPSTGQGGEATRLRG